MENSKTILEVDDEIVQQFKKWSQKENMAVSGFLEKLLNVYANYEEEVQYWFKYHQESPMAVADRAMDGAVLTDQDGVIQCVNSVFPNWLGLNKSDIVGRHISFLDAYFDDSFRIDEIPKDTSSPAVTTITTTNKKVLVFCAIILNNRKNITQVAITFRDVTELIRLKEQLESQQHQIRSLKQARQFDSLIGESRPILQIKEIINEIAKTDVTVLIDGETGVGKEVVAWEIYINSLRKDKPYIRVNCAALSESLLESELFGYEKGAFTGALNREKKGLFEEANNGTILLDEIAELSISSQSKLLRVLQEREIIRVGGVNPIKLNLRIIACTNQNLEQRVAEGRFRRDLYYRLNVISITVPSLRSRKEDIIVLANHFLRQFNSKYKMDKCLDISCLPILEYYEWPGNVRQLENLIERLVIVGSSKLIEDKHIGKIIKSSLDSLPAGQNEDDSTSDQPMQIKEMVAAFEKRIIEEALVCCGSTHKAAKLLGISQPGLFYKARKLGVLKS